MMATRQFRAQTKSNRWAVAHFWKSVNENLRGTPQIVASSDGPRPPSFHCKKDQSCKQHGLYVSKRHHPLTPSLPRLVEFPGWMMHGRACKQYIFWSKKTFVLNAMSFNGDPFICQRKKKKAKSLKGLKFRTFTGRFQMTSWQRRG